MLTARKLRRARHFGDDTTLYEVDFNGKHYAYHSQEMQDARMEMIGTELCMRILLGLDTEDAKRTMLSFIKPWIEDLRSRYHRFDLMVSKTPSLTSARRSHTIERWQRKFEKMYGNRATIKDSEGKRLRLRKEDYIDSSRMLNFFYWEGNSDMEAILNNKDIDFRRVSILDYMTESFKMAQEDKKQE